LNLSEKISWQIVMMVSDEAYFLREATGTSAVAETARTVAAALAHYDIPISSPAVWRCRSMATLG
jgi:hypothetical protein